MTALTRFIPLLIAAGLSLSFSGCRRQTEEAPPPVPAATEEPSSMPPAATAPGPDSSVGVGTPPPSEPTPSAAGERTAGEVVDDTVITTKVKAALVAEPNLKAGDINVDTHNGEVMLSGYLDTQEQIDRAVAVARAVEGVKSVTNKLSLRK